MARERGEVRAAVVGLTRTQTRSFTATRSVCEPLESSRVAGSRAGDASSRGWKPEMQISRYSRASKASLRPCLPISLFAPLSRLLYLLSPSIVFARLRRFVFPPFPFPSAPSSSNIFFPILAPMFLSLEFGFARRLDSLCTPFNGVSCVRGRARSRIVVSRNSYRNAYRARGNSSSIRRREARERAKQRRRRTRRRRRRRR